MQEPLVLRGDWEDAAVGPWVSAAILVILIIGASENGNKLNSEVATYWRNVWER